MSTKSKIQKVRNEVQAHEDRGWLKGYEEGLANREEEVVIAQNALKARNDKIRELRHQKNGPKTAREALDLAWELAYPVKEGQIWPDGAQGISKERGEWLTFTAHCAPPVDERAALAHRSLDPIPDPTPDWLDAAGLLARPLPTREEIAEVLKREFWPFLAHDPANPARFWGQSADAVLALLKGRTR